MNDTANSSRVGSQFGPYRLKRLLGHGGMGEVYEAEDTVRDRIVALKLMSATVSQDPVFRKRMWREARTAGRLQEPHVVPIHDFGEMDGQLFVDMRLIEGTDLATILKRYGPLGPARAVAIISQIASALDAAHAADVVHRDVKPANVLLTRDDFAYLVDFGIASAASDEKLTQVGTTIGTWRYMAPERFTNAEVRPSVDIYALACVLFECWTGSPPYRGDDVNLMTAHLTQSIPRPSEMRPGLSAAFDDVIARGMAKDPGLRYPTAGDLARAAHEALATPDQDRATDILRRSETATLPQRPAFTGTPPPHGRESTPPPAGPPQPKPSPERAWPTPEPHAVPQAPSYGPSSRSTAAPWGGVGNAVAKTPAGGLPAGGPPSGAPPPGGSWAGPPTAGPPPGAVPSPGAGAPPWPQPTPPSDRWGPKRLSLIAGGAAAAVIILVVALVVLWPRSPGPNTDGDDARIKLNVLDDGVFVGQSAELPTIDVFNEPICPPCGAFIRSYSSDIHDAVDNGQIAVRFHLLDFLNHNSASGDYSTRAVAASYCVAAEDDAQSYMEFYFGLFGRNFQPEEFGSTDRTDTQLANVAQSAGAPSSVTGCITSGDEIGAAGTKSDRGYAKLEDLMPNPTTPQVFLDGKVVNISPGWIDSLP